jgi:hypothetical protein
MIMLNLWSKIFDPIPIGQGLIATFIWVVIAACVAYVAYRFGRKVHPVRIRARKVVGPELARTRPSILIATLSPYPRKASKLADDEFIEALGQGDLERLPLSASTQSIGHTVRVLDTYRDSLEEVFLITTVSRQGSSSNAAVALLRNYAQRANPSLVIRADEEYAISLDDDSEVVETAHAVTRRIFERLRKEKRYKPENSTILVDLTGGVRAMQTGALLACLRPEQDIHLIGMRYNATGEAEFDSAFPMVIHFEPDLRLSG